jgi:hypothetical protein
MRYAMKIWDNVGQRRSRSAMGIFNGDKAGALCCDDMVLLYQPLQPPSLRYRKLKRVDFGICSLI